MPRPAMSLRWPARSSTARLTAADPAGESALLTCGQPLSVTCHSIRESIGVLSGARPKSLSYQSWLTEISVTGTTARTWVITTRLRSDLAGREFGIQLADPVGGALLAP